MQFSDTVTKQGMLQHCEFFCGFQDGAITGSTLLKAQFTRLLNIRYAKELAELQLLTGEAGAEDTNYTTQPFSYFDIEDGVGNYQFLTDQAGNTITDITGVLLLPSATATEYSALERLTLDSEDAMLIMSPNPSNVGVPSGFIERNNTVYFDTVPNYDATRGGKLFHRTVPSYFVAGDTTKAPGFVEAYHDVLPLGASYDWLSVNKPDQIATLQNVLGQLTKQQTDLRKYTRMKNPTRSRLVGGRARSI